MSSDLVGRARARTSAILEAETPLGVWGVAHEQSPEEIAIAATEQVSTPARSSGNAVQGGQRSPRCKPSNA